MSTMTITAALPKNFTIEKLMANSLRSARSTNPDAELVSITIQPSGYLDDVDVVAEFTTNMAPITRGATMKHASGGEIGPQPDHGEDVPSYLSDSFHGAELTPIQQHLRNAFEGVRKSLIPLLPGLRRMTEMRQAEFTLCPPPRKDDDEEGKS